MNVQELIEHLKQCDPELPVMVKGYEGGYKDLTPSKIQEKLIIRDYHGQGSYSGPHEELFEWEDPDDIRTPPIKAIILNR